MYRKPLFIIISILFFACTPKSNFDGGENEMINFLGDHNQKQIEQVKELWNRLVINVNIQLLQDETNQLFDLSYDIARIIETGGNETSIRKVQQELTSFKKSLLSDTSTQKSPLSAKTFNNELVGLLAQQTEVIELYRAMFWEVMIEKLDQNQTLIAFPDLSKTSADKVTYHIAALNGWGTPAAFSVDDGNVALKTSSKWLSFAEAQFPKDYLSQNQVIINVTMKDGKDGKVEVKTIDLKEGGGVIEAPKAPWGKL